MKYLKNYKIKKYYCKNTQNCVETTRINFTLSKTAHAMSLSLYYKQKRITNRWNIQLG